jgi:hypothetical protein
MTAAAATTEVRATASAFCFHQGAIRGGFVPLVLTYFATRYNLGYAIPMMVGTCFRRTQLRPGAGIRAGNEGQGARPRSGRRLSARAPGTMLNAIIRWEL